MGGVWRKPGIPEVLGVVPNTGLGKHAVFRVGADDLSTSILKTELLFNTKEDVDHACHIVISQLGVQLTDDDGRGMKISKYPSYPPIENSQCTVQKQYEPHDVLVSFKKAFQGEKTIYARAWNGAGVDSGWTKQGDWMVTQNEAPVPISVTPYLGTARRQTFTITIADPNGAADIDTVEALIALAPRDEVSCHVIVDRRAGKVSLSGGDSVEFASGGGVTNPQCAISNVHVVEERGRMLRLAADVEFSAQFGGRRNIFLKSRDRSMIESGWLWAGSWDVP